MTSEPVGRCAFSLQEIVYNEVWAVMQAVGSRGRYGGSGFTSGSETG